MWFLVAIVLLIFPTFFHFILFMARIIINGINAKSGGGRSILTNLLSILGQRESLHSYIVLVPSMGGYAEFQRGHINIIACPTLSKQILLPFTATVALPHIISMLDGDLIFNLSDIPIPSEIPQIFLFDWPYAAYPESIAWHKGSMHDRVKRQVKYILYQRYIKHIDVLIAQGPAIAKRLSDLYGIYDIPIVPNAVSVDNLSDTLYADKHLGSGYKFLCLSHYYSHKNIEIFIDLAKIIRTKALDWKIIITIDRGQGKGASQLLEDIKKHDLTDIIINIGAIPMAEVPSLYRQCDALLLPTLLESFSGTYVEAMHHSKPIFTSGYEFAHDVCGNAAWYFDPLDVRDIFRVISAALDDPDALNQKISNGRKRLSSMLSWDQAFCGYMKIIDEVLCKARQGKIKV